MSEKQPQPEKCTVTYDISQDNLGPRFRCG